MSETELYEIARRRVDRRSRRYLLWGVNIILWLTFVGVFAGFKDAIPRGPGILIMIVWMGVVGFHGVLLQVAQGRDQAIDGEVERLRQALYEDKPKRLDLNEDGELRDVIDEDATSRQQSTIERELWITFLRENNLTPQSPLHFVERGS